MVDDLNPVTGKTSQKTTQKQLIGETIDSDMVTPDFGRKASWNRK